MPRHSENIEGSLIPNRSAMLHRLSASLHVRGAEQEGAARLLDWHPHVTMIRRGESVTVHDPSGEVSSYRPTLDVDLQDGRQLALEVLPSARVREALADPLLWHARAAVLNRAGRPLHLVTDQDLDAQVLAHAEAHAHFHGVAPDPAAEQEILQLVGRGPYPLQVLRTQVRASLNLSSAAPVDHTLSGLIARRELLVDASRPPHETVLDLPGRSLPLEAPPLGRPLLAVLAELAQGAGAQAEAEASGASAQAVLPGLMLLQTQRGQRLRHLFSLYNDPLELLSRDRAEGLAEETGLSVRSVYRFRQALLAAHADGGGVTFEQLAPHLPRTRLRTRPTRRVSPRVEAVITRLAQVHYFQPVGTSGRARGIADLHRLVRQACLREELPPPALTTVQRHVEWTIQRDPVAATLARDGRERAQALEPRQGRLEVSRYGELWAIDCSPADVFTVEGRTRFELRRSGRGEGQRREDASRGNIITVVDVATGQVLRSELVPGGVGAAQILRVLRGIFLGHTHELERAGVTTLPQAQGLPRRIRMDAGSEFVNAQVERVLQQLGIEVLPRNKWSRHHGGGEERTIGVLTHAHHVLPGTSMNNTARRGDYNAQRHAQLSLEDLDRFHQRFIETHNLQHRPFSLLSRHDHAAELIATGRSALRPLSPEQRDYVQHRMHPEATRKLQRSGLSLHGLIYIAPALGPLIVRRAQVHVSWDPDDISVAQVVDPETGEMITVRARLPQGVRGPLSLSEWKALKGRLRSAQQAARDRVLTPQQLIHEVQQERDEREAARKKGEKKAPSVRLTSLKPAAPREDPARLSTIKAAEIEFDDNPVEA